MLHVEWARESSDVVEESCAIFGRTRLANQMLRVFFSRRTPATAHFRSFLDFGRCRRRVVCLD
jgi:hypothetical protein